MKRRKPRVYLAGQITGNYWRGAIYNEGTYGRNSGETVACCCNREDYFCFEHEADKFIVTGPHSLGCDHSCFHNEGVKHASSYDSERFISPCLEDFGGAFTKYDVKKACLGQIDRSDFVFSYIESKEAYGTIAEIGYAYANNKPIYILFRNEELAKEMWFIGVMASHVWVQEDSYKSESDKYEDVRKTFYEALKHLCPIVTWTK